MPDRYEDVNRVWGDRVFGRYAGFTDRPGRYLVAAILAVALIVLGGWQIGWWFAGQNVNRESHLIRNSYSNQQTLRDEITANVQNVFAINAQIAEDPSAAPALKAQRVAVVNIICGDAVQVVGDPLAPSQASFINANCEAGSVRPGSPYTH